MTGTLGGMIGMTAKSVAWTLIAVTWACGSSSEQPPTATKVAPGQGSAAPAPPDAARLPALLEGDVRMMIRAWVDAQNKGEFAAYEKLYAAKLEGVKRARGRTWRFDRGGWMADRKRMFAHPMTVTASDVHVKMSAGSAAVELTQTFAQGAFQDEGTKRMVIILENGVPRITREEMLQSRSATPLGVDRGVFLVGGEDKALLLQDGAPTTWGGGAKSVSHGPVSLARQGLGNAPAEVKAWRGKQVAAYTADGTRCDATVESVYLEAGVVPHTMTLHEWDAMPEDQVATELLGGSATLMGSLVPDVGCAPVVAIPAGAPAFFAPLADLEIQNKALDAFERLADYKALQKAYRGFGEQGRWATDPRVGVFGAPGQTRYVSVSAAEGAGCGEFEGALWVMWSVSPAGVFTRIPIDDSEAWEPIAVFDSNGDEQIEFVATPARGNRFGRYEALFEMEGGVMKSTQWISYPFNDCGC